MTEELEKLILEFLEVASRLPRSEKAIAFDKAILDKSLVMCPESFRYYEATQVQVLKNKAGTRIFNYLHPDLRSQTKGLCPIACLGCQEVVAWKAPGTDADGFTITKGGLYHIHFCPNCEPDKFKNTEVATELIEKQLYLKYIWKPKPISQ